jgi:histone-binding protein RBBP4
MLLDAVLLHPRRLASAAAAEGRAFPPSSVSIFRSAPHQVKVNRARCLPQLSYTVATKTCVNEVHVYNLAEDGQEASTDVLTFSFI